MLRQRKIVMPAEWHYFDFGRIEQMVSGPLRQQLRIQLYNILQATLFQPCQVVCSNIADRARGEREPWLISLCKDGNYTC